MWTRFRKPARRYISHAEYMEFQGLTEAYVKAMLFRARTRRPEFREMIENIRWDEL